MKKEDLEKFRKRLEEEKSELEEEVKKLEVAADFGDDTDSLEEEADESMEDANQMAVAQAHKERIEDIELALRKMDKGTYGICEKCGKEIPLKVLEINPESRLCQDCKK